MLKRLHCRRPASILALLIGLMAGPAWAQPPVVYNSPTGDGVDPGTPFVMPAQTAVLDLWIAPGPNLTGGEEVVCVNGSGDEICGATVHLQTTGILQMVTFQDDSESDLVFNFQPPSTLVFNRMAARVGDSEPVRIGQLVVDLVGTGSGSLEVGADSEAVGASAQKLTVSDHGSIAMPEPTAGCTLGAGLVVLFALARRRERGGGSRHD